MAVRIDARGGLPTGSRAGDNQLLSCLIGDGQGRPDWFTHFGGQIYTESGIPTIQAALRMADYQIGPIDLIGLGACRSFYERTIARHLQRAGWSPRVFVSDLQEAALQEPVREAFPVYKVLSDSTNLPLPDGKRRRTGQTIVISRAVEHYLSAEGQRKLVTEAARVLNPGELYLPQISSGTPVTLRAFEAGLQAIAGKSERFLTESDYRNLLAEVADRNGGALFEVLGTGYAEPQPRTTLELARRYMNPWFVSLNLSRFDRCPAVLYRAQAAMAVREREVLGAKVASGEMDRDDALALLDYSNERRGVYEPFKNIFQGTVRDSVKGQTISDTDGLSFESDGSPTITLTYPIPILRRTDQPISEK